MTVSIGDFFGAPYNVKKGSKMQEISIMRKIMNWFMYEMVVKKGHHK